MSGFCAVTGYSNKSAASIDGTTWTQGTLPASATWGDVAWNGTVFCAINGSNQSVTSTDGLTWSSTHAVPANYALASDGTIFCAVSQSTAAAISSDGQTWVSHNLPSSNSAADIVWNGNVFCVSGANYAFTSPDGITWTSNSITGWINLLAAKGSVLCGYTAVNNQVAVSTDNGVTWTTHAIPTLDPYAWSGIAASDSVFCIISDDGQNTGASDVVATSPDGVTWTQHTMPSADSWYRIAWDGNVFCAIANFGTKVATSPDGITWTEHTKPVINSYRAIAAKYVPVFTPPVTVATWVKSADVLSEVKEIHIKQSGNWVSAQQGWLNQDGTWVKMFQRAG
jgi:hypothetical protein